MSFVPVLNEGGVVVWDMSIYIYVKTQVILSLANNPFLQHE